MYALSFGERGPNEPFEEEKIPVAGGTSPLSSIQVILFCQLNATCPDQPDDEALFQAVVL
jgi:hypothetical protein